MLSTGKDTALGESLCQGRLCSSAHRKGQISAVLASAHSGSASLRPVTAADMKLLHIVSSIERVAYRCIAVGIVAWGGNLQRQ